MVISYNKDGQELTIEVQPTNNPSGSTCEGGTLIRSAYVNGTWKRSTSTIQFTSDVDPMYTYEMWRSYYQSTGTSAKYLNQGNEGTGIARREQGNYVIEMPAEMIFPKAHRMN